MTRPLTAPGRLVAGRYRLTSQIGGGGMGTVWLARDELLGRQVAVKQVLPPMNADTREAERQKERALREGRIAARLSTPHAISVYDVAVESDQPWLVMEYLPSRSLAEVLSEDGLLRVEQVAQIGAQVADGLAATHAAGIVHRDVKPANILIGRGDRVEGVVKITDFGISHASGDVTLTQTGQITGTPAFLAPEVAQGDEPTPASDVFSLGATLYTCVEGQPPFGMGDNALQLLHKVASGQVEPPRWAGAMTRSLMRMLETDPAARPTLPKVRDELARLAAGRNGDVTTVLMGRTTLSGGPDRPRTSQFPPVPPPASSGGRPAPAASPAPASPPTPVPPPPAAPAAPAAEVEPAVEPPRAAPPAEPAVAEPPADGRRRRRLVPLAVAAGVLVAVGVLLAVLLTRGGGGADPRAAGPSTGTTASTPPASSTSSAPTTASSSSATATTESQAVQSSSAAPTTAPPPAAAPAPTTDVRGFVTGYYALLPGNPQQAYELTGPTLRAAESRSNYIAFWGRFSAVRLGPVSTSDGSLVAHGSVTFVENGTSSTEQHTFTLVRGSNGQLLMDSDRAG
jgi:serine/threonine protein kinase